MVMDGDGSRKQPAMETRSKNEQWIRKFDPTVNSRGRLKPQKGWACLWGSDSAALNSASGTEQDYCCCEGGTAEADIGASRCGRCGRQDVAMWLSLVKESVKPNGSAMSKQQDGPSNPLARSFFGSTLIRDEIGRAHV